MLVQPSVIVRILHTKTTLLILLILFSKQVYKPLQILWNNNLTQVWKEPFYILGISIWLGIMQTTCQPQKCPVIHIYRL